MHWLLVLLLPAAAYSQANIRPALVDAWAAKLGTELWNFGDVVTRKREMQDSFKDAKVESREGLKLVQDIAKEIKNMMELKISAVKRIMDTAENSALTAQGDTVDKNYQYYNAKMLVPPGKGLGMPNGTHEIILTANNRFHNIPVNTTLSAVHVPTSVYDRSPEVLQGIKWSANLDEIFVSNYKQDPTLSWQYFGSSTGFMRQFPAMEWKQEPVDLYDCRMRSWYIEAATSPKDVIVLVDNSGSMMGQRKEIARHVVSNILDTLGSNDFVNVLSFENNTCEVVNCFQDKLVQANLANIRELKLGMKSMKDAANIANFTIALTKAFELLQKYRNEKRGADCNQAIMLITDGVPYNFQEIFAEYNWKNLPFMPVRVFTYLIGREVPEFREIRWMACANQGYYKHLSTIAEVREKVLHYISVMARPMVLGRTQHPVIWTQVYADIADPKMTDWLWEMKEREEQKEKTLRSINNWEPKESEDFPKKKKKPIQNEYDTYPYKMMTSVSMPIYDRRETGSRIANLLGVAGTDVPNSDIQRLMVQHLLGVNAYAFIVTNNGYVLLHPDLRPVFQGILKPSYNSIDITDVELFDDDSEPRAFNRSLLDLREKLIQQSNGSVTLDVKYHFDNLRRANQGKRRYYYNVISGTPFELVVALPDNYGLNRVEAQIEIKRVHVKGKKVYEYFQGKNWKIHPDWFYCKYHYGNEHHFETPEEELLHFLNRSAHQGWKWPLLRSSSPPEHQCDRSLFLSLVYDAKVTEWFSENISSSSADEKGQDMKQRFGLTLVFMATRSGLTRWQDIIVGQENDEDGNNMHFSEIHNKAIDEIWYKRAVEQYLVDPNSFVYSVPFDAGDSNDTLVTASHAIFHTDQSRQAPAAVVGFQFHHSALYARFINITSSCDVQVPCDTTCASDSLDCYVLDNNGYIIVSESREHTGAFFGDVRGGIMQALLDDNVYRPIRIYDYQAVCLERYDSDTSDSCKIFMPVNYISWFLNWLFGHLIWILGQTHLNWLYAATYSYSAEDENYEEGQVPPSQMPEEPSNRPGDKFMNRVAIKKTQPQPCDMQIYLYQLEPETNRANPFRSGSVHCRPYIIYNILHSNLVMVVVNNLCPTRDIKLSVDPVKVDYNSTLACYKLHKQEESYSLPRRRPKQCIDRHPKEQEIEDCGFGTRLSSSSTLIILITFINLKIL